MNEEMENVDWERYGQSKAGDLCEQYRIAKVHFAQCSTPLTFDDFLKTEGIFRNRKEQ